MAITGGYYKMHRDWINHPVLGGDPAQGGEPYDRRIAWVWLIENAAFRDTVLKVPGRAISLRRGQLSYSLRFLAKAWGWNEPAVRRFLARLKTDAMIDAVNDAGRLVITICKYNTYQLEAYRSDAPYDARNDAHVTQERREEEELKNLSNRINSIGERAAPHPLTLDLGDGAAQQVNGHRTVTPKAPRRRPRQAFPADFVLTEDMATYSRSKLPATRPQVLFEAFRNYHTAQGSLMANWPAAWRTWVDREARPRGGHK